MFECLDYIYEVKMVEEMEKVMIIIFLNGDKLFWWMFMDILKDMYMFEVSYVIFLVWWVNFIVMLINLIFSMMFLF